MARPATPIRSIRAGAGRTIRAARKWPSTAAAIGLPRSVASAARVAAPSAPGTSAASNALAYNLMGALFGGLMEYNSMYFGFAFLYLLAIGFYFLAWAFSWQGMPAWLRWPRPLRQDGAV